MDNINFFTGAFTVVIVAMILAALLVPKTALLGLFNYIKFVIQVVIAWIKNLFS